MPLLCGSFGHGRLPEKSGTKCILLLYKLGEALVAQNHSGLDNCTVQSADISIYSGFRCAPKILEIVLSK